MDLQNRAENRIQWTRSKRTLAEEKLERMQNLKAH